MMMILLCHTSDPRPFSLRVHKRMSNTYEAQLRMCRWSYSSWLPPSGRKETVMGIQPIRARLGRLSSATFGSADWMGQMANWDNVEITTCTGLIHKNGTTRDAMRPAHRSFLFLFTIDHKSRCEHVCVLSNGQRECCPGVIHPKQDGRTEHRIRQTDTQLNELHKVNSSGASDLPHRRHTHQTCLCIT